MTYELFLINRICMLSIRLLINHIYFYISITNKILTPIKILTYDAPQGLGNILRYDAPQGLGRILRYDAPQGLGRILTYDAPQGLCSNRQPRNNYKILLPSNNIIYPWSEWRAILITTTPRAFYIDRPAGVWGPQSLFKGVIYQSIMFTVITGLSVRTQTLRGVIP